MKFYSPDQINEAARDSAGPLGDRLCRRQSNMEELLKATGRQGLAGHPDR
jgi:hypothetical protein